MDFDPRKKGAGMSYEAGRRIPARSTVTMAFSWDVSILWVTGYHGTVSTPLHSIMGTPMEKAMAACRSLDPRPPVGITREHHL